MSDVILYDDQWPDVTKSIKTDLFWPEGTTADVHVRPCGQEAWKVLLVIWPAELLPSTLYYRIEMQDCLDLYKLPKRMDPVAAEYPGRRYLVEAVGQELARLASEGISVEIDHHPELNKFVLVKIISPVYESTGSVSWRSYVRGVKGRQKQRRPR